MPLLKLCLNYMSCGSYAVMFEDLCRDCLSREQAAKQRRRDYEPEARIERTHDRLTQKDERAKHERKAGVR